MTAKTSANTSAKTSDVTSPTAASDAVSASGIDIHAPTELLGGLSPEQFMQRHWQKEPLLVRQALPGVTPPIDRATVARLAASDEVESRLVSQQPQDRWSLRQGPIAKLPAWTKPQWTVLLQGLDLHVPAAEALLSRFRFVPEARLDDLMLSYASDGGGVGPHFDSYDVFLIQVSGRRHWHIGRRGVATTGTLRDDVPLKVLADFTPEQDFILEPGDLLYLPPGWAHDGVAVGGDCMTASVGFRSPWRAELANELLVRLTDEGDEDEAPGSDLMYADPRQPATGAPGQIPEALLTFAREAVMKAVQEPLALERALGEALTEPKPHVFFEAGEGLPEGVDVRLDARSRMMYDTAHIFINGAAFRAGGLDATLMRRLADQRRLTAADVAALSEDARTLLDQWAEDGWVQID
ncbi:50S ribosomal protein L16 3-hydroxylase [Roseateles terrae]|uniref:50S ribosomal protein L16 3-hydroxylase n=1 Tax=Roseateles terrae TaxID=431060 RepID=A0ABR6GX73_9BURK|nr:50S ribosomal protein L16 3-hydroxylase [Roseateles terrae]